jgi:hypothetical protein
MGLLDKLWDDTLAGPRPDSGLGKLRKTGATISVTANPFIPESEEGLSWLRERRASAEYQQSNDEARQITQSITIIKPHYLRSLSLDSSLSPAGSSPPTSPSSLTPRERENPWRSNKCNNSVPRSPTVYDWVVIGSWER